ncbi:hypothetical protein [Clostridium estertheticum]
MFTDPFEIKFWDGIVDKFGEGYWNYHK